MSAVTIVRRESYHALIEQKILERNAASRGFFDRESTRLAAMCGSMAQRFAGGGRLLAFGAGSSATDAQHVAVEFVHPVLVGKRSLPAFDLSPSYRSTLSAIVRASDIVMGFGPPEEDRNVARALDAAAARGAVVLALPGSQGTYATAPVSTDPFINQELIEVLYHALWEAVHIFLEHQGLDEDAGAASFLYPFLSEAQGASGSLLEEVAGSIRAKAACDERLRVEVTTAHGRTMIQAAAAIRQRVARGGTVLCFGNGGSATDATDLALDLTASPKGYEAIPALSLSADAATLTALANDIGSDALYARQVIAYGRPEDVAIAISTSGGSANVIAALGEARKRGLLTIALLGYDGGEVARRGLADHAIVVRNDQIPRVQEVQASVYHVMIDLLDAMRHQ
jgi:D-sedoheptulose 7-phosphate isomerase